MFYIPSYLGSLHVTVLEADRLNTTDIATGFTELYAVVSVAGRPFFPGTDIHFLCLALQLKRHNPDEPVGVELNKVRELKWFKNVILGFAF